MTQKNRWMSGMAVLGAMGVAGLAMQQQAEANIVVDYDTPDADTYIFSHQGSSNFGDVSTLRVRGTGSNSWRKHAYVRFDLDGLITDTVTDATLSFEAVGYSGDYPEGATIDVYALNPDYQSGHGQDWGEMSLTNDNAVFPGHWTGITGNATHVGGFEVAGRNGGTWDADRGTRYSISGQALVDFLEASRTSGEDDADLVTFILRDNGTGADGSLYLVAREHSSQDPSALSVTYVPEPSTMGLLAMGGLLMLRRRNRG